MSQLRFAAVDHLFLLALADGDPRLEKIVDWLAQRRLHILVSSNVLQRLEDISISSDVEAPVAQKALGCLTNWGFLTPELSSIQNGLAGNGVARLEASGLLPNASEPELQYLLEAALHDCILCFTCLDELVENPDEVRMTLVDLDLGTPLVVHAIWFFEYISKGELVS